MIYVSTGGFRGLAADSVAGDLLQAGVECIELSGGAYSETLLRDLQALSGEITFQIHNYFPPPSNPFVLNLGSLDDAIGDRSIAHVEHALEWCVALGASRYSIHAGFLIDPKVDELGRRIPARSLYDRDACIDKFVARVTRLADLAEKAGIVLMVENNVLSARNAVEFSANPLLMCHPRECREIMAMLPVTVKLLVDVAHLKVSANSLKFDATQMFVLCEDRIAAYHLSDNDGLEDSNRPFGTDAWFWPYLNSQVDYYSVEVYGCTAEQLKMQVGLAKSKLQMLNRA